MPDAWRDILGSGQVKGLIIQKGIRQLIDVVFVVCLLFGEAPSLAAHFPGVLIPSCGHICQRAQYDAEMLFVPGRQVHAFAQPLSEKGISVIAVDQLFKTCTVSGAFKHIGSIQRVETFVLPFHDPFPLLHKMSCPANGHETRLCMIKIIIDKVGELNIFLRFSGNFCSFSSVDPIWKSTHIAACFYVRIFHKTQTENL